VRASEVLRFSNLTIPRPCGVCFGDTELKAERNKAVKVLARIIMGEGNEFEVTSSEPTEGCGVCARCIGDHDIQAFIRSGADSNQCDFCGRKSRTRLIARPLDEVVDFILPRSSGNMNEPSTRWTGIVGRAGTRIL
jgi:hypothetical protein